MFWYFLASFLLYTQSYDHSAKQKLLIGLKYLEFNKKKIFFLLKTISRYMYINVDINKRNVEYKQYQIFCIVIIYIPFAGSCVS